MVSVLTHQVSNNLLLLFFMLLTSFYNLGNVYIADTYNHRIRKVTVSTGIITTIAGTGSSSYSGDNAAATSATLKFPRCVALDSSGIILIYYPCKYSCFLLASYF